MSLLWIGCIASKQNRDDILVGYFETTSFNNVCFVVVSFTIVFLFFLDAPQHFVGVVGLLADYFSFCFFIIFYLFLLFWSEKVLPYICVTLSKPFLVIQRTARMALKSSFLVSMEANCWKLNFIGPAYRLACRCNRRMDRQGSQKIKIQIRRRNLKNGPAMQRVQIRRRKHEKGSSNIKQ